MEPIPVDTLVKSKSSNSAIRKLGTKSRKQTSRSNGEFKNMESKKRGVYVEKWANPRQIRMEDNKRQARVKTLPKSRIKTNAGPATEEAKLSSFTRLLNAPNADLAKELYKPLSKTISPTTGVIQQNSKMSNLATTHKNQDDIKPQRNIIEMNKKQAKMKKFRSNVLQQAYGKNSEKVITFARKKDIILTPSNTSKLTRDLSDDAHWSRIFPNDLQSNEDKKLSPTLTQHNNNNHYDSDGNNLESKSKTGLEISKFNSNTKKDDDNTKDGKDDNMYNFFVNLLETVYDEKFDNTPAGPKLTIVHSGDSSKIKLEIEENVANKLYNTEQNEQDMNNTTKSKHPNRYTIKDDDNDTIEVDQSQMLADYYNTRAPLIPQKTLRRPRNFTLNKAFTYTRKPIFTQPERELKKKKPKKPKLLSLLKEQLSMDVNMPEPETMYEALCTIARNKNKYRQIRFDTPHKESKSDYDGVCRFKRRKVISPSTRQPRKADVLRSDYNFITTSGKQFVRGSVASMNTESNHSIEVFGFDYDETCPVEPEVDSEYSDNDRIFRKKCVRSIPHMNHGLKTITQCWKL